MTEEVICLDTSVLVKFLVPEGPADLGAVAQQLVLRSIRGRCLVAPAWAWAEVGSVLLKKVRRGELTEEGADGTWDDFLSLPIQFIDMAPLRARAWELAEVYQLPTLYDAAFLACTELAPASEGAPREFWTADDRLLQRLGSRRPDYVRRLGES